LSLVPNPFGNSDYDDDYNSNSDAVTPNTPQIRLIADSSLIADRKCSKNLVMSDNESSCYFLNSSGQHLIHGSFYIFFKMVLLFLISCLCKKRIKAIRIDMDLEKMEMEKKQKQKEEISILNKPQAGSKSK
jgi:hypothetical protein